MKAQFIYFSVIFNVIVIYFFRFSFSFLLDICIFIFSFFYSLFLIIHDYLLLNYICTINYNIVTNITSGLTYIFSI